MTRRSSWVYYFNHKSNEFFTEFLNYLHPGFIGDIEEQKKNI